MGASRIDLNKYTTLHGKDPSFLEYVDEFAAQVNKLSEYQKKKLALYKAAELLNALTQIGERMQDEDRLGPDKAAASRQLAREAIRNRRVELPSGETISLCEPEIKAIIDIGSELFHTGKSDPDQWDRAMALSEAQCISLNTYLEGELDRYINHYKDLYPDTLVQKIKHDFIEPYRV